MHENTIKTKLSIVQPCLSPQKAYKILGETSTSRFKMKKVYDMDHWSCFSWQERVQPLQRRVQPVHEAHRSGLQPREAREIRPDEVRLKVEPEVNFMRKKLGAKIPAGRISQNFFVHNFPLAFFLEGRFLLDLGKIYSLRELMKLTPGPLSN